MATTTPNFGWPVPTSTDYVKDGATAIESLGDAIDASLVDLKGGTSGQVLSKATNADMDFTWVTQDDANAIQNTIVDAKGDIIAATAADTPSRLGVGTNGQVLMADSSTATGLKWANAGVDGGAFLPAVRPFLPPTVTLRATLTATTSGLSYPVNQVFIVAVGGGGSGGPNDTYYNGGGGGGGACIVGWIPTPTAVTIGGSNGNTTVTTANGTITAYAGGVGGNGSNGANAAGGDGVLGSAGGGDAQTGNGSGGRGSVAGLATGGSGGRQMGNFRIAGQAGSSGGGGCGDAAAGNGLFGPGGGSGGNRTAAAGSAYNLATATTYNGGTGTANQAGGGGAGILANGSNNSGSNGGAGGNGGGGGGGVHSSQNGSGGAGGAGVVYIYY